MSKNTPPVEAQSSPPPPPAREIEIFRAGSFTTLDGLTVNFTEADLDELAASYDAARNPAPVVIGHPKTDAPAWGWAKALRVDGGVLKAMIDQLEPAFAQAVSDGRYKRVSPSIYPRGHAASPKPEGLYLKHIGFLGGAAPAVKGLAPVAFSEEALAGCITIEGWDAVPQAPTAPAESPIDFAERESALAAREAAVAEAERKLRHDGNLAFAQGLVADVKLAPAARDKVVFLLNALGTADGTLCFGEGEGAQSATDAFKSLLQAGHPVIALGEHAPAGEDCFDDLDGVSLGKRAQAFADQQRAKGISISAAAAVAHVKKEKL